MAGTTDSPPDDLTRWGLHAFCLGAVATPQRVIGLDDNGRLLHLARGGVTRAELARRDIRATASAVALLELFGLLEQRGEELFTVFPVIGPETLGELRRFTRGLAERAADELLPEVAAIATELGDRGWAGHEYAVVFGHAVDGLLWDELRRIGLAPDTVPDRAHPLWKGVFWAIHPARPDSAGVNESVSGDDALVMVWTPGSTVDLDRAAADPDVVEGAPVVVADDSDPVHRASMQLARTLAAQLDAPEAMSALTELLVDGEPGVGDRVTATVIVGHELIWDVMDVLLERGALRLPPDAAHRMFRRRQVG